MHKLVLILLSCASYLPLSTSFLCSLSSFQLFCPRSSSSPFPYLVSQFCITCLLFFIWFICPHQFNCVLSVNSTVHSIYSLSLSLFLSSRFILFNRTLRFLPSLEHLLTLTVTSSNQTFAWCHCSLKIIVLFTGEKFFNKGLLRLRNILQ